VEEVLVHLIRKLDFLSANSIQTSSMASSERFLGHSLEYPFLNSVTGLRPEVWLIVGSGYSREDFKTRILDRGRGFVSDAVTTPQEVCLQILGLAQESVLPPSGRQELLRFLLAEKRIMAGLTEIKKVRRQRQFIQSLDLAIQSGRLAFAHPAEEEVYLQRLHQIFGDQPLRNELRAFAGGYEAWMGASGFFDLPLLLKRATQRLREEGWPMGVRKPKEIYLASTQTPESLEREFWEVLGILVPLKSVVNQGGGDDPISCEVEWLRWHTLDDAAEFFADHLLGRLGVDPNFDQTAILIPDIPKVRRVLSRALAMRGIPLAEPRDPTQVRGDETLKLGLLLLRLVAQNFERQDVISWLRIGVTEVAKEGLNEASVARMTRVDEIHLRGIRSGLKSYHGGVLEDLYHQLEKLQQALNGRKTAKEFRAIHQVLLRDLRVKVPRIDQAWIVFESLWNSLLEDLERIGQQEKKAPLLYWLERLETRLGEASPPVESLKPRFGVRLYRLQQAPVIPAEHVWLFGVPPRWLSGEGLGDLWFSERDREVLSTEFAIRSRFQIREERLQVIGQWLKSARKVSVLEAEYDSDGRERESLLLWFKELAQAFKLQAPERPKLCGAHGRTLKSYSSIRKTQLTQIQLEPLDRSVTGGAIELSATLVDRHSRCGFQALAFHRWKLKDTREPGIDLWPDVRGTLLHDAVRILMKARSASGTFSVPPAQALDEAWMRQRPRGLMRTRRVENYVRSRLVRVLEVFCEKEKDYFLRAQTRPVSLDDLTLRLNYSEFSIRGKPDRIDQCDLGLMIFDYKTAGGVPHGTEILDYGYRLQLPFYAVAASHQFGQDVLGVQFIELDSKGGRKSGILFQEFNGKEPGKLTQLRSNSKSLFSLPREEVWTRLEQEIVKTAESYVAGQFEAKPRLSPSSKECSFCRASDLCGLKRRTE